MINSIKSAGSVQAPFEYPVLTFVIGQHSYALLKINPPGLMHFVDTFVSRYAPKGSKDSRIQGFKALLGE